MKTNRKTVEVTKRPLCERGSYLGANSLLCFPCKSCTLTKEECEQLCPGERNESPPLTPSPIPQSTTKATEKASHDEHLYFIVLVVTSVIIFILLLLIVVLVYRRCRYCTHRPGYRFSNEKARRGLGPHVRIPRHGPVFEEDLDAGTYLEKSASVYIQPQQSSDYLKEKITAGGEIICPANHSAGVHQDPPRATHRPTLDSNSANLTNQMESSLGRLSQEDEDNLLSQPSSCQNGGSHSLRSTVAAHDSWETFDDDNGPVVSLEADAVSSQSEVDHDTRQASEDPGDACNYMYDTPDSPEDLYGPGSLPPGSHDYVSQSVHDYLEKLPWVRTTLSSGGKIEVMVKGIAQNTAKEQILRETNLKRHQLTVTTFISSSFCYA